MAMRDVLLALFNANIALSLAVLAVALLRPAVRRWCGAEAAYRLWITAPLAALASLAPVERPGLAASGLDAFTRAEHGWIAHADRSGALLTVWLAGLGAALVAV